jgi:radical SAM superfamily enzyme YgiQ (UPF0313 family)
MDEIKHDIARIRPYFIDVKRIFLADGNALVIPTPKLIKILDLLNENFPKLERVSIYACPQDLLRKAVPELKELRTHGLGIVYMGLESGSDIILQLVKKDVTSRDMIYVARKVKEAKITLSVIFILGLGGRRANSEHALKTAEVLNAMDPEYIGALTLMVIPGTEMHDVIESGEMELLEPRHVFMELHMIIKGLTLTQCVFRANHASNYLPVGGTLPGDKSDMLRRIERILEMKDISFKPEWLRAL